MSEDIPGDDDAPSPPRRAELLTMAERRATRAEQEAAEVRQPFSARTLNWSALKARGEPPRRDWIIDHWIGSGHVTLLSGSGGIGKSVLSLQLATSVALGIPFLAPIARPRVSLVWMAEDDHDEIWRRQTAICAKFGAGLDRLTGGLYVDAMGDADCTLLQQTMGNVLTRTSVLTALRERVIATNAELVVLDNIGRFYGGNENDRHHVTTFLAALNWAAAPTGAAIVLLGHISRAPASEFSGSSAWENAARSRLWFTDTHPDVQTIGDAAEKDEAPTDLRYLAKRKANYSSRDVCTMRYVDGAYDIVKPPSGGSGLIRTIDRGNANRAVMTALRALLVMNFTCSDAPTSHQYLPKLILQHQLADGHTKRDLADAMHRLVADGEIVRYIVKRANRSGDRVELRPKQ